LAREEELFLKKSVAFLDRRRKEKPFASMHRQLSMRNWPFFLFFFVGIYSFQPPNKKTSFILRVLLTHELLHFFFIVRLLLLSLTKRKSF
jgi:hypothetical protein